MRRLIALLMTCVLLAGMQGALAESDALELWDDIDIVDEGMSADGDADALLVDDIGDLAIDGALSLDGELSIDELPAPNDCLAAVSNDGAPVELSIKKNASKTVTLGLTYQIKVPGKKIKRCKSSNKNIATVTNKGLIETLDTGSVKITITLTNGKKLTLKLKVVDPETPTGVTINEGAEAELSSGETMQLTATVEPDTAPQEVEWSSDNTAVATVDDDGLVTAHLAGKATISAVTENGLEATLELTVRNSSSYRYMISHAMGGVDGYSYTNSLEGFLANYAEGHRIFEVDFKYTTDKKLVLWHSWDEPFCSKYEAGYKPSYKQFMKSKLFDRFTPLDIKALLKLMDQYPDVLIVTDSKSPTVSTAKKEFKDVLSIARDLKLTRVLDRLVVEVYTEDMYKAVKKIYPFKSYMLSLYIAYKSAPSLKEMKRIAKMCRKNDIATVAMYTEWWRPEYAPILKSYDLDIALYTVNSASEAQAYFDEGVNALFTDFLPPV